MPQYDAAEIGRAGEAAVLTLTSYEWNFDIVPCFFTVPDGQNRTYYLIPDGNGDWKKTDPRRDRDRVKATDDTSPGNVLAAVRLVKRWNQRPTMPSVPSYLLECLVIDFYQTRVATKWVDVEFGPVLDYLAVAVWKPVNDPKGTQGDLNALTYDERRKVSERATLDAGRAKVARALEVSGSQAESITAWGQILGEGFPKFG